MQPGVADTVKNALVRPAPDRRKGRYAIEVTVTNLTPPTQQFEQAGITWYHKGKPVFKLVKELIDGKTVDHPRQEAHGDQVGAAPAGRDRRQLDCPIPPGRTKGEFQTAAEGQARRRRTRTRSASSATTARRTPSTGSGSMISASSNCRSDVLWHPPPERKE